ncbi:MAG: nitroreductase family protein [Candidatus Omnitrophica bacterium]|nr:nitroreductase family protein [Candidatus Omnitrophota bacterium]MBU4458085.1 nitroreductase family protein [Candidatus Omnitrophota bacterium]
MDFCKLVKKRKSTRKYSLKPVPREIIEKCLEAARLAPSACNSQPWSFIVVDDKDLKDKVAEAAFSAPYTLNTFAKKAPVLIVAVTERTKYITRVAGFFRGIHFALVDVAIACEHLILQAEEEGVGTCWLGWFNESKVKKILRIPKRKKIDIIISMGYPEKEETREQIRKPLAKIRRYNKEPM